MHVLLYFIGKNFEEGISVSSLNRKLSGLAFLFHLLGLPDATKSFLVRKALQGYRKGRHPARFSLACFIRNAGCALGAFAQGLLFSFRSGSFLDRFCSGLLRGPPRG